MNSLISLFRSTERRQIRSAVALAIAMNAGVVCVRAQDEVEKRYQQGVEFFNNAKMEEACEILQQLEKDKPGYKQTKVYMNVACTQFKRMVKMEEDSFNEGVLDFNQGRLDDAKQKFEQVIKVPLKSPQYRIQASRYLKDIEAAQNTESLFQEGVRFFNAGKYPDALRTFEKVRQGGGPKATEAQNYLDRLRQLLKAENQPRPPVPPPAPPRPMPSSSPLPPSPDESLLRTGLQEYFEGKLDDAERDLSAYVDNKGSKRALALFFRGAGRSTRYFLSRQRDTQQKDLAVSDFRAAKQQSTQFDPPQELVSPQIMAIYTEAVHTP
jgi:tetratricopeptide (TPR) repeat protein